MDIPSIIRNDQGIYEGDLVHYFRSFEKHAKNIRNPYHNFGHVFHVVFMCYDACMYYREQLSCRQMRNLLIAALYHDYDHPGRTGNDDLNIELAIRGFRSHVISKDKNYVDDVITIIRASEFPHTIKSCDLGLEAQILRDADMSQALSVVWVQPVIIGLGDEMRVGMNDMFRKQKEFLGGLSFCTVWAQEKFPQSVIDAKIAEAEGFLEILI